MFYVPNGTKKCGYYECDRCGYKFLSIQTMDRIDCSCCEDDVDNEIGPDEDMKDMQSMRDTAKLIEVLEGEDVEKMDALLSLAITGGNFEWI